MPLPHRPSQLARKIRETVESLGLDLRGRRILTEAATGAYVVTPVIAAVAGAEVVAFTRSTRYGSAEEVRRQTLALATELDVANRIRVVESLSDEDLGTADVVTNSGHLRPLDAARVDRMKPGSVIPLMYESWELRPGEIDLDACKRRNVQVAGTNECHERIRVFDYLGMLAVLGLLRCKVSVPFSRILLICQNPFAPFIARTLVGCQADLEVLEGTDLPPGITVRRRAVDASGDYDAVVLADTPGARPILGRPGAARYSLDQIGRTGALIQVWGDVDRTCLEGIACYPEAPPHAGHMGILLSELGPESIVRLQAGGLKVGEVLTSRAPSVEALKYCQLL